MSQYICSMCGAYLDPGERCTCMDKHRNMFQKKQFNYDFTERMGIRNDTLRTYRTVSAAR